MPLFNLVLESPDTLKISFGDPSTNDLISAEVDATLTRTKFEGGKLLKIDGACSLPVAFVLAHRLCHLYGVIAVKDPKLSAYVVAISHDPTHKVGDKIPA